MSPRSVLRAAVAASFAGMGVGHFVPQVARGMAAMIPPAIADRSPVGRRALVRVSGVCELAGAAGLLLPSTRRVAAGALIALLAAVFPANAYAARDPERFGPVAIPFWPRLAGQVGLAVLVAAAGGGRLSR